MQHNKLIVAGKQQNFVEKDFGWTGHAATGLYYAIQQLQSTVIRNHMKLASYSSVSLENWNLLFFAFVVIFSPCWLLLLLLLLLFLFPMMSPLLNAVVVDDDILQQFVYSLYFSFFEHISLV